MCMRTMECPHHMTDQPVNPEIQAAQDMLAAMQNQRNAAQNECVQLAAQLTAANREIAELKEKVKALTPADEPKAKPNGKSKEAHAAA